MDELKIPVFCRRTHWKNIVWSLLITWPVLIATKNGWKCFHGSWKITQFCCQKRCKICPQLSLKKQLVLTPAKWLEMSTGFLTWNATFGSRANLGCSCGLRRRSLLTLYPGDWANATVTPTEREKYDKHCWRVTAEVQIESVIYHPTLCHLLRNYQNIRCDRFLRRVSHQNKLWWSWKWTEQITSICFHYLATQHEKECGELNYQHDENCSQGV